MPARLRHFCSVTRQVQIGFSLSTASQFSRAGTGPGSAVCTSDSLSYLQTLNQITSLQVVQRVQGSQNQRLEYFANCPEIESRSFNVVGDECDMCLRKERQQGENKRALNVSKQFQCHIGSNWRFIENYLNANVTESLQSFIWLSDTSRTQTKASSEMLFWGAFFSFYMT